MISKEYESVTGISQSAIKDFRSMPPIEWKKIWITKEKEHKKSVALGVGSLVDDLLFNPSKVEDKYIIHEAKKPSAAITYIIEGVFNPDKELGDLTEEIVAKAKLAPMPDNKTGYGQSYKEETLLKKVQEEGGDYFEFLKKTNGKYVIQNTDYMKGLMMAENTKKSELVKPYLDPEYNQFQFQIVTDDDFPDKLKGCLDILHEKDGAKQIIDFKTADSAYYFETNVRKFGYLEQMSFYDHLLRKYCSDRADNTYLLDSVLQPINIVIDSVYMTPYIYEYNWRDLMAAWEGYFKYGKRQKGLLDWIREIQWHILNDLWAFPMEHYLYGHIKLDLINHYNKE